MSKVSFRGKGDPIRVAGIIGEAVADSGMSCKVVDSFIRTICDGFLVVSVYEKYFYRAGNYASLTVSVVGNGSNVVVDAIGSGGGQGPLFKFSWGAEKSFVNVVCDCLEQMGFVCIERKT